MKGNRGARRKPRGRGLRACQEGGQSFSDFRNILLSFLVPRFLAPRILSFSLVRMPGATRSGIESRTRELVPLELEHPQVRQVPDRLGDRACTSRERGTCEKSPIRFRRVAWALRVLESNHAPVRALPQSSRCCRLVRFPIDSGIAPAHRGNGERVRNLRFGSVA